ncbi:MAG: CvpA family protein, partial [Clostridia bacterium]|nr:CvpA family protein [Clostridia bacterium]
LETDGLTFQERVFRLFIEDSKVFTVVENGGAADYVATDAQVASYIGERLAAVIIVVIAAVAVFIALKIAILLLSKLFNALTKNHAISGLDRTLGMLFGFAKGALLVTLVLGVFYLLANSTVYGWINNSVVTKWIYQRVVELVDFVAHRYDLPAFITSLFPQLSPPAFIGLI